MTVPSDATTGERQVLVPADALETLLRFPATALHNPCRHSWECTAGDAPVRLQAALDGAQWRRLGSPEPSDAERVEAAHQRTVADLGLRDIGQHITMPGGFPPGILRHISDWATDTIGLRRKLLLTPIDGLPHPHTRGFFLTFTESGEGDDIWPWSTPVTVSRTDSQTDAGRQ